MTLFLQQLVNGLTIGAIYAVFAVGFGLVFSSLGILNVAQGVFSTWAGLGVYFLSRDHGLGIAPAAIIALAFAALLGVIVDRVAFETLRKREASLLSPLMTSIGIWITLRAIAEYVAGSYALAFPSGALGSTHYELLDVRVRAAELLAMVSCLVVGIALHWTLKHSKLGLAIRAVGWNAHAAQISGLNPTFLFRFTVALSAVISGLAGILYGMVTDSVSAEMGEALLLKGFAAVVIGGVGDVRGTVLGGLIIGMSEVFGSQYIGGDFRDAFTFGLLFLFLVVRPRGLMGEIDPVRA